MKNSLKILASMLIIIFFVMQSCSKQEVAITENPEEKPVPSQNENKELKTYEVTIIDSDNWELYFNHKYNYSQNVYYGSGLMKFSSYGTNYEASASMINHNQYDIFTMLSYDERYNSYLLYLMKWIDISSPASSGAYIYMKPGGFASDINANLTNGTINTHTGGESAFNKDTKKSLDLWVNKEKSIVPNDYDIYIVDSDEWNIYLNKVSFSNASYYYYRGKLLWTKYGVDYIGDAAAIYIPSKDAFGIMAIDDSKDDAFQYNVQFTDPTTSVLKGFYFYLNQTYRYAIDADLLKGTIGNHTPSEPNEPLLKNQSELSIKAKN
ncbi:hypothetical protein ACFLSI_00860 [Bacteroidota bacterium]